MPDSMADIDLRAAESAIVTTVTCPRRNGNRQRKLEAERPRARLATTVQRVHALKISTEGDWREERITEMGVGVPTQGIVL